MNLQHIIDFEFEERCGLWGRCGKVCWGVEKIKGNEEKSVGVWGRCGKVCWMWGR